MVNACAIGLWTYSSFHPAGDDFGKFYNLVIDTFQKLGLKPTYFAAEGAGYRGDLTKYNGRTHSKALKTNFANIHVMALVVNPDGSDEPGYDSFASASLSYVKETGETLLCLMMEEQFLEFGGDIFEEILKSFISLMSWDFGYALSQPIEKKPEFHILGIDDGKLDMEDRRKLNMWYASCPDERQHKLRDIYPYIILNSQQLSSPVTVENSLEAFARSEPQSSLISVDGSSLCLWKIMPDKVSKIREKLSTSGILITSP